MKVFDAPLQKIQAAANSNSSDANANRTSTNGHSRGGVDHAIDYGNRGARERNLSDTTIMSMPSKTSYQACGNESQAIQFDPTGRYLLIRP